MGTERRITALEDNVSADKGHVDGYLPELWQGGGVWVLAPDGHIRQFTYLNGAFDSLLVAGVGAAHRVGPQRFLDRQALVRRVSG